MSCEDIPSLLDLQKVKKHADDFGRLMGTGIGTSTNEVTGQVRPTFNKVVYEMNSEFDTMIGGMNNEFDSQILNMGFTRIGTFAAGATLTNHRQTLLWDIADGGDGQEYGWSGKFPLTGKVVPPGSTPLTTGGIAVGTWMSRFDPELRVQVREALRRSYAEAGYTLVAGSFEKGGVVANPYDALLYEAENKAYSWGGLTSKTVGAGSTPTSSGGISPTAWIDQSSNAARKKLVILATGQSNVQQEMPINWTPPSNVYVWQWPGRRLTGVRFGPCPSTKANHTYVCAAELARLNPDWDVYVVKIGAGGRSIAHWLPGGSSAFGEAWDAYADCKTNVEAAMAVLGVSKIDYLHWHQGESDINDQPSYVSKWEQMHARFAAETWFDSTTHTLVNGVASATNVGVPEYAGINLKLRAIVGASPSLRTFIPTSEIIPPNLWQEDMVHMTGEGHLALGAAEAQAMQFGGTLPIPQGYSYAPETRQVCIGGGEPISGGGTLVVNKGLTSSGASYNSQTSLEVINDQRQPGDGVAFRVVGPNGTYSITGYSQGNLANVAVTEWTGTDPIRHIVPTNSSHHFYCGATKAMEVHGVSWIPGVDALIQIGTAAKRLKTIYLETAPVVGSDERMKTTPEAISDLVLDAWAEVNFYSFKMLASVERDGDAALIRCGVIAQRIIDAFASKGLNALHYGLLWYDRWEANKDTEAGDRYSVVYEEALVLEAELQRRKYQRLLARIEALESK